MVKNADAIIPYVPYAWQETFKNNLNTFDLEIRLTAYSRLILYNLFLHDALARLYPKLRTRFSL
ncbi:hypothetical protein PCC6912_19030 [Chlorogloeopsis fritschii PCC 6912]|uniref:Uncharacterized protein n=2 Tax=Chlorogloeopsis fritschii TaxID=1124 RepID=A0A3S1A1U6_CHLFR|nr:hypothetical protein PCC6912_19030 [Chlorogloeopsis fritschii PCC 6912]